jgi:serine/threonine-protein kinase HipA
MLSVPVGHADRQYILKIDPPEYPHVVKNEAFSLRLAAETGMRVARAELVHDITGRPGLLVDRFDRLQGADGVTVRAAVEDGSQVLGLYPAEKYSITSEVVVTALADLCTARTVALQDLFKQLCFAWLTGNGDVHAKNLSILAGPDGEWRTSNLDQRLMDADLPFTPQAMNALRRGLRNRRRTAVPPLG